MTRFRLGPRFVPGQRASSPSKAHGLIPNNAGIAPVAQDRIDLLASAAARKAKEAISGIDAVSLYIFQPLRHGVACNCGAQANYDTIRNDASNPNTVGIIEDSDEVDDIDDFKPRLKVRVRDLTPEDHFKRSTPRSLEDEIFGDDPITSTSGTVDPYSADADPEIDKGPYEGKMEGAGRLYVNRGSYDNELAAASEFGEELISDYENEFDVESTLRDSAYVIGSSLATCPICFGSGLLGGYSVVGGTKLTLSSANATGGDNIGPESGDPAYYELEPGNSIIWEEQSLPNYFSLGWSIPRYMRRRLDGVLMEYSLDGNTWKPIGLLEDDRTVDLSQIQFRLTNDSQEPVKFTHWEITVFHTPVRGQVTNFAPLAGSSQAIKGNGIQITLPPEVGVIDRNSLIGDNKYRLMWRVVDLETIMTAKRQVISVTANTELMEPSLVETTLFPHYSVDGDPQKIFGAGVEPIMGMR